MISCRTDIDEEHLGDLEDRQAYLYLLGKPTSFKKLRLGETTFSIFDPLPDVPGA